MTILQNIDLLIEEAKRRGLTPSSITLDPDSYDQFRELILAEAGVKTVSLFPKLVSLRYRELDVVTDRERYDGRVFIEIENI